MELVSYTLNILLFNTKPICLSTQKENTNPSEWLVREQHCTETEYSWNTVVFPKPAAFQILFFFCTTQTRTQRQPFPFPRVRKLPR